MNRKLRSIYASAYSAAITIVSVVVVTVGAELSASFKNWLAGFTGHHWVTKSYLSLIVFVVCYFLLFVIKRFVSGTQTRKALVVLEVSAILGFVAILGFYLYEFFIS